MKWMFKKVGLFFIILGLPFLGFSQIISLEKSTAIALENNGVIKNENLKAAYRKALIETFRIQHNTTIGSEFGQVNSAFFDTNINISQTFSLPKASISTKNVLVSEYIYANLNTKLKVFELKKTVEMVFYQHQYLVSKQNLLLKSDSLNYETMKYLKYRFEKGETDILDLSAAELKQSELKILLKIVADELTQNKIYFDYLLNTTQFTPEIIPLKIKEDFIVNNTSFSRISIELAQQENQILKAQTKEISSRSLPDLTVGYNNGSFRGPGFFEKTYTAFNRFHTFQVGVAIPIFKTSLKAKINANKILELVTEKQIELASQQLDFNQEKLLLKCKETKALILLYEEETLPKIEKIILLADLKFRKGSLNYFEKLFYQNQKMDLEMKYLELVKVHNDYLIELKYLI